jgi:hypothetical protein
MPASFKKIVFYGPALAGKRTCVHLLHERARPDDRGRLMLSPPTSGAEGFLTWFDWKHRRGPLRVGCVGGQVFKDDARRELVDGAHGVVFVADSSPHRIEAGLEAMENLREQIGAQGRDPRRVPMALLYNKRDAAGALPWTEIRRGLGLIPPPGLGAPPEALLPPEFDGVAPRGVGVVEAFESVAERVFAAA